MRILRINSQDVDVDEKTAIGITFKSYDFKEPGKRKVSLSNSFSIPLTATNKAIIGFANDVQSLDMSIYSAMTCDYYVDNYPMIEGGSVRIDEITQDRIKMYVVNKDSFWDELKAYGWEEFIKDYEDWLVDQGEYLIGFQGTPNYFSGTLAGFLANQITGSRLLIPMYLGHFYQYNPGGGFLENESKITMAYDADSGGHVCTYVKSIFEFIEFKFGVDFLTSSADTTILWNDTYAPNIYIPIRAYTLATDGMGGYAWHTIFQNVYQPYEVYNYGDKTLYDLVLSFFQLFNVIVDDSIIDGTLTIELRRFDDIENDAPVIDFSGNLDLTSISFKPKLADYQKTNYIKYTDVYPGAQENEGAKVILCKNNNLDETKDLFEIDAYYPDVLAATYGQSIVNLSTEESFKTFAFMISNGLTATPIDMYQQTTNITSQILELAQIYSISGEYNFIDTIAEYPKSYTVSKWLKLFDIVDFKYFAQYYIQELNGSFFVNKISNFNPEKSNKPTKIELIRVSDKTPIPIGDTDDESYFVDGLDNVFIDGNGNRFI